MSLLNTAPRPTGGEQGRAEMAGQVLTLPVTYLVTVGLLASLGFSFLPLK